MSLGSDSRPLPGGAAIFGTVLLAPRRLAALVLPAAWLLAAPAPASAAAAATGYYAAWDRTGSSGSWSGTAPVVAAGFPTASWTSNSTGLTVPTGASAFLGAGTPFGAAFGSSQGLPYLSVPTASGVTPSTTTLTFAAPTPATGWGFALGDVDADKVQIAAIDANLNALTGTALASALGFQGTFNYCAGAPKPSTCSGSATDVPTWDPATATLIGSGTDTSGAAGWFQPTVALGSLTFTFTAQLGIPIYQL